MSDGDKNEMPSEGFRQIKTNNGGEALSDTELSENISDSSFRKQSEQLRIARVRKFKNALLQKGDDKNETPSDSGGLSEYKTRLRELINDPVDTNIEGAAKETCGKSATEKINRENGKNLLTAGSDDSKPTVRTSHEGHRKRLRAAVSIDRKLEAMSDVEILETALSYFIPRKDTNAAAHEILAKHSLAQVLSDAPNTMAGVKNVTELAVKVIDAIGDIGVFCGASEVRLATREAAVGYFCMALFGDEKRGTHVVYLDERAGLIAHEVYGGDAYVDTKRIAGGVYAHDAKYVMIGRREYELFFSAFDYIESIDVLAEILESMDSKLLDCFIFNEFGYYSLSGGAFGKGNGVFTFTPLSAVVASPELCEKLAKKALADRAKKENSRKDDQHDS